MKIDKKIIDQATECKKGFKCLKEGACCPIKIDSIDGNLYVKCDYALYCNFQFVVNNDKVCTCPVRREIYKKYGK